MVLEDLSLVKDEIKKLQRVILIGCGTSLYAAMVGRYFMENLAGITAEVDSSSRVPIQGISKWMGIPW